MTVFEYILFLVLVMIGLALSALCAGVETGLYTINRVRLTNRANRGHGSARQLQNLLADPRSLLSTILIGNNVANYAGSYGVAAILTGMHFSPGQAIAINAGILIPILFVCGEVLPKDLFRTHTDHWSYSLAGFLTWMKRIFTWTGLVPLVRGIGYLIQLVLGHTTVGGEESARQRIGQMFKEGIGAGAISEAQSSLVDRALTLRGRIVSREMVPWSAVKHISISANPASRVVMFQSLSHTRLPVIDENGRVAGILSALDAVISPAAPTRQIMVTPLCISADTSVRRALHTMRRAGQAMAVVTQKDDSDQPIGVVTFKDLVEPLTGELSVW